MRKLEPIDVRILQELLRDGRKSFVSIAQAANISTDIVSKHFNEMEKEGIIVGATVQFNYTLFGYQGITSILIRCEPQQTEEVVAYLRKIPNLNAFTIYGSPYTIMIVTIIKSIKELENLNEIIKKYYPIVTTRSFLWTNVRNTPENLTMNLPLQSVIAQFPEKSQLEKSDVTFDDLDLKIVDELGRNGRATFSRIAEAVDSSTDTVKRRYDRLVANEFIKVSIQINPQLLGYKAIVNFLISLSRQDDLSEAVEVLSIVPDLSYLVKVSGGDCDLLVCTFARDLEDIFSVIEKIGKISGVEKIEYYLSRAPPFWPSPSQYLTTF